MENGRQPCDFCPRRCRIAAGELGWCGAVRNSDGAPNNLNNGARNPSFGLRLVRSERLGLGRFCGGRQVLGVESRGSGLLQTTPGPDWIVATADFPEVGPEEAVFLAQAWGCPGVVLETDDPVFQLGEGGRLLALARQARLATSLITTGFVLAERRGETFANVDAVAFRLYGTSAAVYRRLFEAPVQPVLDCLSWLAARPDILLEITVPLIAGGNDAPGDLAALFGYISERLGPDVRVQVAVCNGCRECRMELGEPSPIGAFPELMDTLTTSATPATSTPRLSVVRA